MNKASVYVGLDYHSSFIQVCAVDTTGRILINRRCGNDVLPPPATFDFGILMVAMLVHFPLSILYAVIAAPIFARMSAGPALVVGAVLGLLLYLINFYGFTAVFDWFAMARNWVSAFAHGAFGLVAALAYKGLARQLPQGQLPQA